MFIDFTEASWLACQREKRKRKCHLWPSLVSSRSTLFALIPRHCNLRLTQSCNHIIIRFHRQRLNRINVRNSRIGRIVVCHFDLTKVVVFKGPHNERKQQCSTHHRSGANAPHSANLKEHHHHRNQASLFTHAKFYTYTHRGRRDSRTYRGSRERERRGRGRGRDEGRERERDGGREREFKLRKANNVVMTIIVDVFQIHKNRRQSQTYNTSWSQHSLNFLNFLEFNISTSPP